MVFNSYVRLYVFYQFLRYWHWNIQFSWFHIDQLNCLIVNRTHRSQTIFTHKTTFYWRPQTILSLPISKAPLYWEAQGLSWWRFFEVGWFCRHILVMWPAPITTISWNQVQIISPISISKQHCQAVKSCSETIHRPMVAEYYLYNRFHNIAQGSVTLEIGMILIQPSWNKSTQYWLSVLLLLLSCFSRAG